MSELIVIRWDPASQTWVEQRLALEPGAMLILPGDPVRPPIVRIKTKSSCNVRNAPSPDGSSDIGDLAAGKTMIGQPYGDYYEVRLYVHKSMVQEVTS